MFRWLLTVLVGPAQPGPTSRAWLVTTYELDLPADASLVTAKSPYSRAAVYAIVAQQVEECLCLETDDGEVRRLKTLIGDLGTESIDFLDLIFRLEQAFGIEILREDLHARDILESPTFVSGNRVNDQGLVRLQNRMQWRDLSPSSAFGVSRKTEDLDGFLTVGDLCRCVESKVAMLA
ncbi:hypothetical protein CL628_02105 [bacterium]|nr:hypothetical protein [bacterium]